MPRPSPTSNRALLRARDLVAAVTILATLGLTGPARAQNAAAEAVFDEGAKLFKAGDFARACPKLKSAVNLASGDALGGRLLLAECFEKQGKWASAWALYREIAPKAATAGSAARKEKAEAGLARVEPRLARLQIEIAPEVARLPGLTIERDGEVIRRELWDVSFPLDPGTASITARAAGKRPAVQSIPIADAPATTRARIDPMVDEEVAPLPPVQPVPPPPRDVGPLPAAAEGGLGGPGIAGIVLGSAGIVGMGVGTLVAVGAKSSWDDADAARDEVGVDDARGTGDVATVVFVGGTVLAAVGVTLLVVDLAGPTGAKASAVSPRVEVRWGGAALSARGSF